MEKGLLDIGLLLEPVDMEKYEFIRLNIREKWVVLMKSDDPLQERNGKRKRFVCTAFDSS